MESVRTRQKKFILAATYASKLVTDAQRVSAWNYLLIP